MDSRLVFAVVLLWCVCACAAFSTRQFVDHVTKINTFAPANATCTSLFQCADEGDDCTGDWTKNPTCNVTNGSCCAIGLFCVNGECATDNMGSNCTSNSQCDTAIEAKVACVSNQCQYIYGPGDSCTTSADCISPLNCSNSVCTGASLGQNCTSLPCGFGLTCMQVNATLGRLCYNDVSANGVCNLTTAGCFPGTACYQGTCQGVFTIAAGKSCPYAGAPLCQTGLTCAFNKTCVAATDEVSSCTQGSTDCPNGAPCTCSPFTGDYYCADPLLNPCTDQMSDLISCQVSNNCTTDYQSPDSCLYNNCYSDIKKANSCGCDEQDSLASNCIYNTYCGGFPVWAIIVIIVVAIVLVLAIVLLVFFMMRRRRVYDSI